MLLTWSSFCIDRIEKFPSVLEVSKKKEKKKKCNLLRAVCPFLKAFYKKLNQKFLLTKKRIKMKNLKKGDYVYFDFDLDSKYLTKGKYYEVKHVGKHNFWIECDYNTGLTCSKYDCAHLNFKKWKIKK